MVLAGAAPLLPNMPRLPLGVCRRRRARYTVSREQAGGKAAPASCRSQRVPEGMFEKCCLNWVQMTGDLPAKPASVFRSQKPPTEPVLSAPDKAAVFQEQQARLCGHRLCWGKGHLCGDHSPGRTGHFPKGNIIMISTNLKLNT